jgi:hypothetical protein
MATKGTKSSKPGVTPVIAESDEHHRRLGEADKRFRHAIVLAAHELTRRTDFAGDSAYGSGLEAAADVFKRAALAAEEVWWREMRSFRLVDK